LIVASARSYDRAMRSCARPLVCLALLAVVPPARAAGNDGPLLLRRGIQLYRDAAYAQSAALLERARSRGLGASERIECAFYLGADYVALDSPAAARRELRVVLQEAPDFEPPQFTSPKVEALFRDVREELERAPRLRPLPPERHGEGLVVRFEASRTGGPGFGAVYWRWRGEPGWRETPLGHVRNEMQATLPVDATIGHPIGHPIGRGGTLEYFADGRAPAGMLQAGSADRPLELPMADEPARRERSRGAGARLWWVWTGLGALAAAGAGVGLYFALRPQPVATADAVFDFQVR
jgi:hypothetical protein